MLQINSGKLYQRGVGRRNALTGVLHTNARLPWEGRIETAAGSLRGAGFDRGDRYCVFEMEERIEAPEEGPGVLVSHGVGPFLDDMATVATIGLGALFSRRAEDIRALTGDDATFSSYSAPKQFIARLYEREVYAGDEEVAAFQAFVDDLIALDRRSYLAAMRAMRTLVAGLHRIADDLALAYTLMVSAVETLAQEFDAHSAVWNDVESRKREAIDQALASVDADAGDKVRAALLAHEHVALARRYRAFALSYIDASYFRAPAEGARPIARFEVEPALKQAYALRSAYIHQARKLPDPISHPHAHWEVASIDRRPALTFQGLYRLSRHVIQRFVAEGRKVETEVYESYRNEEAGVVIMEWAPQYLVGRPLTSSDQALRRLEQQLSLTASVFLKEPDVQLIDLKPVLQDVERLLPQAPRDHRPALLNLHFLFNLLVSPDLRSPSFEAFVDTYEAEASSPGPISLMVSTLFGATASWSIEAHREAVQSYFEQRLRPKGLHAPRVFEAAALLVLAEKERVAGDESATRTSLARAVESHPGHEGLRKFEAAFSFETPINWRAVLLLEMEADVEAADEPIEKD